MKTVGLSREAASSRSKRIGIDGLADAVECAWMAVERMVVRDGHSAGYTRHQILVTTTKAGDNVRFYAADGDDQVGLCDSLINEYRGAAFGRAEECKFFWRVTVMGFPA